MKGSLSCIQNDDLELCQLSWREEVVIKLRIHNDKNIYDDNARVLSCHVIMVEGGSCLRPQ